jgi:Winged helix-turn helix
LSREELAPFAQIVEAGADREIDRPVRWRRIDLKHVIVERFAVDVHPRYVGELLKKLGLSDISARPCHPMQDERIVEGFKKTFRAAHLYGVPATTPVEIWFQMLWRRAATMSRPVLHLALELSATSWVIAYRFPQSDKVRLQRVSAGEGAGLLTLVSDLREKVAARMGPDVQVFRSWPRRILAASPPDRQRRHQSRR